MSADSKRGPGARAASTDTEQSYTFDDLCLALDWFSSGLCDCVAQARVLSDILRGAASPFSPSSLFGRDGGGPWEAPPQASGPGATRRRARLRLRKRGGGARDPLRARRTAGLRRGGVGPEGGGGRGADRRSGPR